MNKKSRLNLSEATLEELITELLIIENDTTPRGWLRRYNIKNAIANRKRRTTQREKETTEWNK